MNRRRILGWMVVASVPLWFLAQQAAKLTVTLRHRDVRSVAARVAEELGPQGQIWVDRSKNQVTVEDTPSRLDKVRILLSEMDAPARRFALSAHLDVLAPQEQKGLFRASPKFVDMTAWAETAKPSASYDGVLDVAEGKSGSCLLGRTYRLEAKAQGYDPERRRLALESLSLRHLQDGQPEVPVLQGAAVLPVGSPTVLLIQQTDATPPLRLRATPELLPAIAAPEAR